jgi:ribosome-binding protein aMBF1 (putative translation factor)
MPSYYQPNKFKKQLERRKRKAAHLNDKLRKRFLAEGKPTPDELLLRIGKEIAGLRTAAGLTQRKLGEIAGTYQSAIGRMETGRANLTIKNLRKIAKILGKKLKIEIL